MRRGFGGGGGALRQKNNPRDRNDGRRPMPGGMPGTPQPDYFAQFNAWQDPNIGGEQPGPLQQGWGGFGQGQTLGGAAGTGAGTMMATKMNGWLNTFTDPVERMKAMNGIGYNNGGNPYTPQVPRGTNRGYRAMAQENQATGGYSAPGVYQHQTAGASADNLANFGGYTGFTTVGDNGAAQYTPFDINRQGGRLRRRGGTFGTRY